MKNLYLLFNYDSTFGMQMPSRTWMGGDTYLYGMNGQEEDDEIFNGAYNAEYWEYDSRLGRRWNVDPVIKEWESPYACFLNNPIYYADPSGLDGEGPNGECPGDKKTITVNGHTSNYEYVDNKTGWLGTGMEANLGEVEVSQIPGFVQEPNSVDYEIGNNGVEHYAPKRVPTPDYVTQWEKDLADYNFDVETKRWNKLSYEQKWNEAYQGIMMGQLNDFAQKAAKPIAQLYTIQAQLGGSGMASGLGTGLVTKAAISFEEALANKGILGLTTHGAEQMVNRGFTSEAVLKIVSEGSVQEVVYKGQAQIHYVYGKYRVATAVTGQNAGKIISIMGDYGEQGANGIRGIFTGF